MTAFESLLQGGESGTPAIVAGKPDDSYLVQMITPADGRAEMPQGKPPLAASDIERIRSWIEQGATDDTPANARARYDQDHLPVYTRPPVVSSLDFSRTGALLAVAGFHEVLLLQRGRFPARGATGRSCGADRVGAILAGRRATGRRGRVAVPHGRSADLGCCGVVRCSCPCRPPTTRSTGAAGRRTARWLPSAARITRSGPSKPPRASKSLTWPRMMTGFAGRSSPATANRSSPRAAT